MKPSLMLAKKITQDELKEWSQFDWENHYVEPKIDGERFVRTKDGIWLSRNGKKKYNVEGLCSAIDSVKKFKGFIIDGELFGGDWSSTISAAHSHEETGIELQYRIFDVVWPSKLELPLTFRKEMLANLVEEAHNINKRIVAVPSTIVSSYDDFMHVFRQHCATGCDGAMLKHRKSPYTLKRSSDWLKIKPYMEMDCKIVGFNEGKGKYVGTLGSIEVRVPDMRQKGGWSAFVTKVGCGMDDPDRDKIWRDRKKLIGKLAEVRYRKISEKKSKMIEARLVRVRVDL